MTNFPTALDAFSNPAPTDTLDSVAVPHAAQHANANDAIEALQAKVGVDGSADTSSLDYRMTAAEVGKADAVHAHSQADIDGLSAALAGKEVAGSAASAIAAHEAASDPHPGYLTPAEANAAYAAAGHNHAGVYDPAGTAGGAVAAHEAAPDPHPQYATPAEASAAAPVQSVAGKTGTVTLVKADVGLSNVDNTSDANKPVSTAQAAAIAAKADASHTHGALMPAGGSAGQVLVKNSATQNDASWATPTAISTVSTEGALIAGAVEKTTPVDADLVGLVDSAASNVLKKLSWSNIKTALKSLFATKTYVQSRQLNLVTNGSGLMGDNTNFSQTTFSASEFYGGGGSFYVQSNITLTTDELIPIDPSRAYQLSLWGMSGDTGGGNHVAGNTNHWGVSFYDIDGLVMNSAHYAKMAGSTDTRLSIALNPGDTTITLVDATGWYNGANKSNRNISWYGYVDGKGHLWPDYTYTRNCKNNVASGVWPQEGISGNVITLTVPWNGPALAAGTAVSNCQDGGTNVLYILGTAIALTNSWQRFSGKIMPVKSRETMVVGENIPPAAAYIRPALLCNWNANTTRVRISCVALTELSATNLESNIGIGANYKLLPQASLPTNGLAVEGKLGVGTSGPSAKADIESTTEQLRLRYSASYYASFIVDSSGALKIAAPLTWRPAASGNPAVNGDLTVHAVSNTSLALRYKGSDGVVRSTTLTLT